MHKFMQTFYIYKNYLITPPKFDFVLTGAYRLPGTDELQILLHNI